MALNIWKKSLIHVGCISTEKGLALITRKQNHADLIELRFDALYASHTDALERVITILQKRKNPVLLTMRTKNEGGLYSWKSTERSRLFTRLIPYVDAIDIELANLPLLRQPLKMARSRDKKIIISAHSTSRKITYKRGVQWLTHMRKNRADLFKIAALARTQQDLNVLAKLLIDHSELRIGIMAIGPMAAQSRKVLPLLGSRLVYGYLDVPAAKNQPSLKEIRESMI